MKPTHAGGIVFRETNGAKEFLLISAKNFPFIWVLPKGHIKLSETAANAAIREVKEESGMKVSPVRKIGNANYLQWNLRRQSVAFFLMKFKAVHSLNEENRKIIWLPLDTAICNLFYLY